MQKLSEVIMNYRLSRDYRHGNLIDLFCLTLLLLSGGVKAQSVQYDLRLYGKPHQNNLVQVYNRRTGKPVWSHSYILAGTLSEKDLFFWSPDHQSLAFPVIVQRQTNPVTGAYESPYEGFHLIVWHAGEGIQLIAHQRMTADDEVEEMGWSPDGKLLLIKAGGSGGLMDDSGRLYCYDVVKHKVSFINYAIGKPFWVGAKTVKYWEQTHKSIHYSDGQVGVAIVRSRRPFFWQLPFAQRH